VRGEPIGGEGEREWGFKLGGWRVGRKRIEKGMDGDRGGAWEGGGYTPGRGGGGARGERGRQLEKMMGAWVWEEVTVKCKGGGGGSGGEGSGGAVKNVRVEGRGLKG